MSLRGILQYQVLEIFQFSCASENKTEENITENITIRYVYLENGNNSQKTDGTRTG
jgi:hypothetical protein